MSGAAKRLRVLALPLGDGGLSKHSPAELLKRLRGKVSDLPAPIAKALREAKAVVGDGLLILHQREIRAVGLVMRSVGEEIEWLQREVALPEILNPVPEYGARELKDSEVEALFDALEREPPRQEAPADVAAAPQLPPTVVRANSPRNMILHGPPGTGKTFNTARYALHLLGFEDALTLASGGTSYKVTDAACAEAFRAFQAHDRVAFVTFHQSYGYEEFIEGLRPTLNAAGEVQYEMHAGIFLKTAQAARKEWERVQLVAGRSFNGLWDRLRAEIKSNPTKLYRTKSEAVPRFVLLADQTDELSVKATDASARHRVRRTVLEYLWTHRGELGGTPEAITMTAMDNVAGPIHGFLGSDRTGIWVVLQELFRLDSATSTELPTVPQFVLILDEINRGNISKIFGELITLLEPDKRLGMPHELTLPLAYSPGERFGVPPNLHLLGTMNTADRSIALLDVALRRRFEFEEVMPDPECIPRVLERNGVTDAAFRDHVKRVLTVLNARIRFLLDREHQIGHAYLLGVRSYADLRAVFVTKVIPLLQEYFHGAWDRVCIVLGCPYTRPDGVGNPAPARKGHTKKAYEQPMMEAVSLSEVETIGFNHDEFDDRVEYVLNDTFRTSPDEAVLKLYFDELVAKPT